MVKYLSTAAFVFVLCLGISAQDNMRKLDDLGWLSGCWESNDKAKQLFLSEQWMKPVGGMMLGIGRTVKGSKAVDFEYMRIEQQGGDIFFIALPKENKEETRFKLIRSGATEAVFENPDHDFPQRVIYKLHGTKLTGRIEGNNEGKFTAIDFPFVRTKCE